MAVDGAFISEVSTEVWKYVILNCSQACGTGLKSQLLLRLRARGLEDQWATEIRTALLSAVTFKKYLFPESHQTFGPPIFLGNLW